MKELMLESMLNLDCGEMYVKGDTLYMPLLYSSQISAIVDDIPQPDTGWKPLAVRQGASVFAAGLSLRSLVENYAIHDPASYELARANLLKRYEIENIDTQINLQDRMLEKLVFEVMPYFVRINEDIRNRKEPTKTEILNRLAEKANIPLDEYRGKVKLVSDNTPLEKAIEQLKSLQQGLTFPNEGIITGSALEDWFKGALENHILNKEAELRENIMAIREEFLAKELDRQAVQLYLA
ncbi:MAG: hypothetical protein EHM12_13370, partial [Dehalococcoidia bacterium]